VADSPLVGIVIEESLVDQAVLDRLRTVRTESVTATDATPEQPRRWTLRHFEAPGEQAETLAGLLAAALRPGPWYVDFVVGDEHVVAFSDRVFRYRRSDEAGADAARVYGRAVGVPEAQLDWED